MATAARDAVLGGDQAPDRSSSGSDSTLISATPASSAKASSRGGLADAGKDDALGRHAGGQGPADLALRDGVGAGAEPRQGAQHREVGVGLHRVGDQRLAELGCAAQGVAEHPEVPLQRGGRIDIDRRADRLGDAPARRTPSQVSSPSWSSKWFMSGGERRRRDGSSDRRHARGARSARRGGLAWRRLAVDGPCIGAGRWVGQRLRFAVVRLRRWPPWPPPPSGPAYSALAFAPNSGAGWSRSPDLAAAARAATASATAASGDDGVCGS